MISRFSCVGKHGPHLILISLILYTACHEGLVLNEIGPAAHKALFRQAASMAKLSPAAYYKYKPSGSPSLFVLSTFSLAARKSAMLTLILRSLNAIKPASEQMARMSAPERSSFI